MKLFANPLFPSFCRGIDGLFHQILFVGLFAGCKTIFFCAKSYRLSCYEQVIKYVFVVLNYSILRKLYLVGNFVICRRVFLLVFYNIEFQYFKLLSFFSFFFFFELVSLQLDSLFWLIVLQKKCCSIQVSTIVCFICCR